MQAFGKLAIFIPPLVTFRIRSVWRKGCCCYGDAGCGSILVCAALSELTIRRSISVCGGGEGLRGTGNLRKDELDVGVEKERFAFSSFSFSEKRFVDSFLENS